MANSNKSKIESLESKIFDIKLTQLENNGKKYDQLIEKLTNSQIELNSRVIVLESSEENHNKQIDKLINSNGFQNKLLVTIVTASIGTLLTLLLKALIH